jgi:hypothetical protein
MGVMRASEGGAIRGSIVPIDLPHTVVQFDVTANMTTGFTADDSLFEIKYNTDQIHSRVGVTVHLLSDTSIKNYYVNADRRSLTIELMSPIMFLMPEFVISRLARSLHETNSQVVRNESDFIGGRVQPMLAYLNSAKVPREGATVRLNNHQTFTPRRVQYMTTIDLGVEVDSEVNPIKWQNFFGADSVGADCYETKTMMNLVYFEFEVYKEKQTEEPENKDVRVFYSDGGQQFRNRNGYAGAPSNTGVGGASSSRVHAQARNRSGASTSRGGGETDKRKRQKQSFPARVEEERARGSVSDEEQLQRDMDDNQAYYDRELKKYEAKDYASQKTQSHENSNFSPRIVDKNLRSRVFSPRGTSVTLGYKTPRKGYVYGNSPIQTPLPDSPDEDDDDSLFKKTFLSEPTSIYRKNKRRHPKKKNKGSQGATTGRPTKRLLTMEEESGNNDSDVSMMGDDSLTHSEMNQALLTTYKGSSSATHLTPVKKVTPPTSTSTEEEGDTDWENWDMDEEEEKEDGVKNFAKDAERVRNSSRSFRTDVDEYEEYENGGEEYTNYTINGEYDCGVMPVVKKKNSGATSRTSSTKKRSVNGSLKKKTKKTKND